MPLWLIYHTDDTFVDNDSKAALTRDITKFYTNIGLPAFYVVVNFIKLSGSDMWVGAEPRLTTSGKTNSFVRITISHVAVRIPDDADGVHRRTTVTFGDILKPHVAEKGYHYEFHVEETDRRLWMIDGYIPPEYKSAGEALWAKENKAVPYE
ncbi:hypothetical protein G7054_g2553 [Neopestalotiopsis clavispora]|nr:hypothetical protein G7054_g2553 [Neopestalotiopsis clavispora]